MFTQRYSTEIWHYLNMCREKEESSHRLTATFHILQREISPVRRNDFKTLSIAFQSGEMSEWSNNNAADGKIKTHQGDSRSNAAWAESQPVGWTQHDSTSLNQHEDMSCFLGNAEVLTVNPVLCNGGTVMETETLFSISTSCPMWHQHSNAAYPHRNPACFGQKAGIKSNTVTLHSPRGVMLSHHMQY